MVLFFKSRLCGCPLMFTLHAKSGFPWKNQGQPLSQSPFLSLFGSRAEKMDSNDCVT
eukprot:UN08868